MVKLMPKEIGKVTNYNNITGFIVTTKEKIPFHEKDIISPNNYKENILNEYVEFNIETLKNNDKVARNIKKIKTKK